MAVPVPFPEQNSVIGSGDQSPCYRDGAQTIVCVSPTPQELQELMVTGKLWVIVAGSHLPSIVVTGHHPFEVTEH